MGGGANCNVGPSREIDMFGGPGLAPGPAPGQGLGAGSAKSPGLGLAPQKSTKKKDKASSKSQQQQPIDWSARMVDMKRINTLIRSKEEEDAYWSKLRNTNHDNALERDDGDGDDDGNGKTNITNITNNYTLI